MPKALEIVTRLNPLAYGIDGLRGALISVTEFGLITDFTILIVVAVILLALGSYLFEKIQV